MKKYLKILYTFIACAVMPFVFCACTNNNDNVIKVSKISLNKDAITLVMDGDKSSTDEFTVSFEPANANQIDVEFAQYDKNLIEISQKRNSSDTFVVKAKALSEESRSTIVVVRMKGNVNVSCKIFVKVSRKALSNLSVPTNIHYNEEYSRVEWDSCPQTVEQGFNGYIVNINGEEYITSSEKNFIALSEEKFGKGVQNSVRVKAISLIDDYNSDYSETYNFLVLDDVKNLSHNNGIVTWESVAGASGYQYRCNTNVISLEKDALEYTQTFEQKGEYEIEVTALSNNVVEKDGNVIYCFGSGSAKIVVTKLSAPENFQYKRLFSWDSVSYANGYEIYEVNRNDSSKVLIGETKNISYKLDRDLSVGSHSYTIRAIGNGKTTITSDYSAIKTVTKLSTPTGLRVEDGIVSWDKDPNAISYQISFCGYYDGVIYGGPNGNDFYETSREENALFYIDQPDESASKIIFSLGEKFKGNYKIRVASVSDAENTVDSNWTQEIFVTKLLSPDKATFGVEDNKIVWQAVANASAYEIVLNINGDETIDKVYSNSYIVPQNILKGEFSIKIRSLGNTATGDDDKYVNSDLSSTVYAQKLEAPILKVDNGVLVWNVIKNSSKYILNINNVDYDMGKQTKFDFSGLEAKEYNIKIRAVGGNASTIGANSLIGSFESSYSVVRTVKKLSAPVLSLQEGNLKTISNDENANIILNTIQRNQDGSFSLTAYSQGNSSDLEGEKGNITSDLSNMLTYFQAPNPSNLKIENGVLVWDELETLYQGSYFKMTINAEVNEENTSSELIFKNSEHSYDFSNYESGSYSISLKIVGTTSGTTGNLVMSSGETNIAFIILPCTKPYVTNYELLVSSIYQPNNIVLPGTICWEVVGIGQQNAIGYNIKVENGTTIKTYDLGKSNSFILPDEAGEYKVSVQAYGDNQAIINGQYSVPITVTKLTAASNIRIDNNGHIEWDSDYNKTGTSYEESHRVSYCIELNGNNYLPFSMSDWDGIGNDAIVRKYTELNKLYNGNTNNFLQGDYKLKIITVPLNMSENTDLISDPSVTLSFTKLQQPYGLKVDKNENDHYIINWTQLFDSNVNGYELLIKEASKKDSEGQIISLAGSENTSFDFTENYLLTNGIKTGNYIVKVRAISTNENIINSEFGAEIFIKLVSNIDLSIKNGQLAWSKVVGATSYEFEFTINGEKFTKNLPANLTSYAMTIKNDERFIAGIYNIRVKVIADVTSNYGDVIYLDNYEYKDCGSFTKLDTPTNLKVTNGKITFNSKNIPDYFNLYMNGNVNDTIKLENSIVDTLSRNATYELAEKYGAGSYSFKVQAMGDDNYLSSEISDSITPNEVKKLKETTPYLKDGILNWNYVENSNGFQVEISGAKFYIYDSESGEYTEEATGNAFDIKISSGITAINLSEELTSVDNRKFMLGAGEYSVRIKSLGTDITYLNSNFTNYYTFIKLKQIDNVRIENGSLVWDKILSVDAPNKIALYIKFDGESEFRKPIVLDSSVNSFDFAGTTYPAQNGYEAYLQVIGDTNLSISNKKLGNISGTPSNIAKSIEKLSSPSNLQVVQSTESNLNSKQIGILVFDTHPEFNGEEYKYLLSITIKSDSTETTLDDVLLTENQFELISENLGNIELASGLELIFKVKFLGLDSFINSDFSNTLTIIIPQSPMISTVKDEQGSFTGKVIWSEVKVGDFNTKYQVEYKFISKDTITDESELTNEKIWESAGINRFDTYNTYLYVVKNGYYKFKVKAMLNIGSSVILSPDTDYSSIYHYNLFKGGEGSQESPFEIDSVDTFNYIRYNVTAHYKLIGDLDFDNLTIYNIGTEAEKFTGTFNGDGHILKNIVLSDVTDSSSIFDYVGIGGIIKNVVIQNIKIHNGANVGGIVGINEGEIYNVKVGARINKIVDSSLSTEENIVYKYVYSYDNISAISPRSTLRQIVACGGIVGLNKGSVVNCDNYAIVAPKNDYEEVRCGGIAGHNEGKIEYSYNHNNIGGTSVEDISANMSGGIVGYNLDFNASIDNCGNFGNVFAISRNENAISQNAYAGGICAYNNRGTVSNCFNDNSNGIYEKNEQNVIKSSTQIYAKTVYSEMGIFVGGLVGYNEKNSKIQNSYTLSNIQYSLDGTSATANTGSIAGKNEAVYMNVKNGLRAYSLAGSLVTNVGESFQTGAAYVTADIDEFSGWLENVLGKNSTEICKVIYKEGI